MTGFGRCSVQSAALYGVEAVPVDVEVAVTTGMPGFHIVGMVDAAVQEARERVRVALKSSGFSMPGDRVLVSLAPSSLKKTGSGFDLAIAVGILVATGQIQPSVAQGSLFVGELSLDGGVRPVKGLLAYAMCARDMGYALVCSHFADGLIPVDGLRDRGIEKLRDLMDPECNAIDYGCPCPDAPEIDYADVSGNEVAKRAVQIAAAGNHGLLMMGPPGSGKTMLASRIPTIMPPLSDDERLQVALVHSVAGVDISECLAGLRPFRHPHHSATAPGLIGGGNPIRPGEISLAHLGVLFLDELPEFRSSVLQQMRQPLEEGKVRISRADGTVTFPSRFMLVAAANPCACGFFGDPERSCTCSPKRISEYQGKIGGPLMDRIDLHIDVRRVPPKDVLSKSGGTSSAQLKEGVFRGRSYASWRRSRESYPRTTQGLIASCHLVADDELFFEDAAVANSMSGRAIVRTLSVARTIADMDERARVSREDLCEALGLRLRPGVGEQS